MRPVVRPNVPRLRKNLTELASAALDFVELAAEASELLGKAVPFERSCWHTVDPGTVLFTGSVNLNVSCSGQWLAEHEYGADDVNLWRNLARTGVLVGTTSGATGGDLNRSRRHRLSASSGAGVGDELRVSFVADGVYWGAAGLIRDADQPWFTDDEVRTVRAVTDVLATASRRTLVRSLDAIEKGPPVEGPGVIVLDASGAAEITTPAAERWVEEMLEEPPPRSAATSKVVQSVAAAARARGTDGEPLASPSRARVRTRSGAWVLVYATVLDDAPESRTAVVIQPALPGEVAPVVALAHGFTTRETDVARLCLQGLTTKEMGLALGLSSYTVQDHLKSIFDKTGTRTRHELVARVFLSHYVTRWEQVEDAPRGWTVNASPETVHTRSP